jgi:hypothetical protein
MNTWFNACEFYDIYGKENNESYVFAGNSNNPDYYLTDCKIHDIQCVRTWWERGTTYKNIGDIIWWGKTNSFFVNFTIDNLGPSPDNPTHPHSDLILYYNPGRAVDNLIMYNGVVNMNALCMGFMSGDSTPITNNAIVNLLMQTSELRPDVGSQMINFDHLIMWHNTIENFPLLFRLENGFVGWNRNSDIRDNIFFRVSGPINNSNIDKNHFNTLAWDQTVPLGTRATVGNPYFVDTTSPPLGYHLQDVSPAYRNGIALECVPADIDGNPFEAQTPSLGVYSSLSTTQMIHSSSIAPREFAVSQNYPNPFNPSTKIKFVVPTDGHVRIRVYNCLGQIVTTPFEGDVKASQYQTVGIDGTRLSSGVFFYSIEHRCQQITKRMVLIK